MPLASAAAIDLLRCSRECNSPKTQCKQEVDTEINRRLTWTMNAALARSENSKIANYNLNKCSKRFEKTYS